MQLHPLLKGVVLPLHNWAGKPDEVLAKDRTAGRVQPAHALLQQLIVAIAWSERVKLEGDPNSIFNFSFNICKSSNLIFNGLL